MCAARQKVFLLFTVIFAYDHCMCTPVEPDRPKLRLPNGTILAHGTTINILQGNPLELYCTGHTNHLEVTVRKDKPWDYQTISGLPNNVLNQTTIKIFEEHPKRKIYDISCYSDVIIGTSISVLVDSKPVVSNFGCKSDVFINLKCNWISVNFLLNSSLYYIENGVSYTLCSHRKHYTDQLLDFHTDTLTTSMSCTWDETHHVKRFMWIPETITLLTNSCNVHGCTNQTFAIDLLAVTKLSAPLMPTLYTSSHSVVLQWNEPLVDFSITSPFWPLESPDVNYTIIFIYSGNHQLQVNKSISSFYPKGGVRDGTITIALELSLPCADTYYDARLSIKLATAGEEFWSDEGLTSFRTDPEPEDEDSAVDATCEHRRVLITSDVMLFEIDRFKSKMREEQKMLKDRIMSLKSKVDEFLSYLDIIYTMTKDFMSYLKSLSGLFSSNRRSYDDSVSIL